MNKQLLQRHLQTLLTDCESQELSLRQTLDISWDAYDIGNWAAMVQSILEIAKELNIELTVEEYQDEG